MQRKYVNLVLSLAGATRRNHEYTGIHRFAYTWTGTHQTQFHYYTITNCMFNLSENHNLVNLKPTLTEPSVYCHSNFLKFLKICNNQGIFCVWILYNNNLHVWWSNAPAVLMLKVLLWIISDWCCDQQSHTLVLLEIA